MNNSSVPPASSSPGVAAQAGRMFVGYVRVSTASQGRSGLGLEAQAAVIRAYLQPSDRLIVPLCVEVESGRNAARPVLAEALARCQRTGAVLLVAKLDRLSRNLPFLRAILDGGVDVAFCDLPHVPTGATGRFLLMQLACVAELEAGLISERTKAALAAAKARGVKLGGDRGYRPAAAPDPHVAGAASGEARHRSANHAAHALAPAVAALRQTGATSLAKIAAGLAEQGVASPGGSVWTATAVRRVLARIEAG